MAEKKRYLTAKVPILNSEMRVLGTPEDLNDKTIKLDMTRQMRGKGLTITFRLFNNEGSVVAIPNKMELVKSYIQRMMRKRVDYVEDSFTARCTDIRTTIKPLLITRKRVSRAVRRNLRNTTKEFLLEYLKNKTYTEICDELIEGTLQRTMLPKLKKVYPLSFCDIRVFETKELAKIDLKKIIEDSEKAEEETQFNETTDEESNEETEDIQEVKEEETKAEDIQEVKEEAETEEKSADAE